MKEIRRIREMHNFIQTLFFSWVLRAWSLLYTFKTTLLFSSADDTPTDFVNVTLHDHISNTTVHLLVLPNTSLRHIIKLHTRHDPSNLTITFHGTPVHSSAFIHTLHPLSVQLHLYLDNRQLLHASQSTLSTVQSQLNESTARNAQLKSALEKAENAFVLSESVKEQQIASLAARMSLEIAALKDENSRLYQWKAETEERVRRLVQAQRNEMQRLVAELDTLRSVKPSQWFHPLASPLMIIEDK